ncbi:MAG: nitroreductase family protein [Clostridiales bacterium]|nr:nitroreductase family protein [Clostridiales bacterium]
MEAIKTRRSVRKFEDKPVEKEKIDLLLRAAMQAPSAHNEQPWEFIVVENKETLEKLSEADKYTTAMKNGTLAIVCVTDEKYFFSNTNIWMQDLSAASENILLEAVELGLGATWIAITPLEDRMAYIKDLFQLPDGVIAFNMIIIGYPAKVKGFEDRFKPERVHYEQW